MNYSIGMYANEAKYVDKDLPIDRIIKTGFREGGGVGSLKLQSGGGVGKMGADYMVSILVINISR